MNTWAQFGLLVLGFILFLTLVMPYLSKETKLGGILSLLTLFGMWAGFGYGAYAIAADGGTMVEVALCLIPFGILSWLIFAIFTGRGVP